MGEDDESARHGFGPLQDGSELCEGRNTGCSSTGNVPVGRVEFGTGPHDGGQAHLGGDGSNSVIDITVRRSERVGRDTDGFPDRLHCPTEFGDNLLVGQVGEVWMRPSVDGNLMSRYVLGDKHLRSRDDSRPDDEEGGRQIVLVQIVEQDGRVRRRSIIVGETPVVLVGTGNDIGRSSATTTRPPTSRRILDGLRRVEARTGGGTKLGNIAEIELGQPRLDLGRVYGRNPVQRRVSGRRGISGGDRGCVADSGRRGSSWICGVQTDRALRGHAGGDGGSITGDFGQFGIAAKFKGLTE